MNASTIFAASRGYDLGEAAVLRFVHQIAGWRFSTSYTDMKWSWLYLMYFLVAVQSASVVWMFWWKAPSDVIIKAWPTPLGRWLTALRMIVDAERLVQRGYDEADGKAFAIPMTDRWIVFVSNHNQLRQLEREQETVLSMEEALHELAFTKLILGNHQVAPESKAKSEAFRITSGVLKNKLRSNIPAMAGAIQKRIKDAVALELSSHSGGADEGEWQKIRLMPALLRIFTRVNLLVFVGEELADRDEVYDDVMNFFWGCVRAFAVANLAPSFLTPLLAAVVLGWGGARQKVFNFLLWLTRKSLDEGDSGDAADEKPGDGHLTGWSAKMARLTDARAIAKVTLGLLFASAFQVPVIAQFIIYRLGSHPEYHDRLRQEAQECRDGVFGCVNQDMPYLDSFMKETARLTPGVLFSAPRKVMVPYTSADGIHVPTGNWLAIPQASVMRDAKAWPRPTSFEGFRFVDGEEGSSESRLTHPSYDFPFWGAIRHACPARFYVAAALKMIFAHLLLDFEFKLADPSVRPFFTLGKTRLPNPFQSILVRRRPMAAAGGSDMIWVGGSLVELQMRPPGGELLKNSFIL